MTSGEHTPGSPGSSGRGTSPPNTGWGCYGLQLHGTGELGRALAGASQWMLPPAPSWPSWRLQWTPLSAAAFDQPARDELSADRARLVASASGGWIELDRPSQSTRFHTPEPLSPAALVHPYLTSTAAIAAHWLGRTPFHAGGFSIGGGAWGVLGGREMGKSSLLMGLHAAGVTVVSDDLIVLEEGRVYSGPRCLDLRQGAAERFGTGRSLGRVGRRDRWRVDLPPAPPDLPLAGWVVLGWSSDVVIELVGTSQRLGALATNRAVTARGEVPRDLLDAVAHPVLLFSRSRDWAKMSEGIERLLEALADR